MGIMIKPAMTNKPPMASLALRCNMVYLTCKDMSTATRAPNYSDVP